MQGAGRWCCHLADQFVLYYFLYLSVLSLRSLLLRRIELWWATYFNYFHLGLYGPIISPLLSKLHPHISPCWHGPPLVLQKCVMSPALFWNVLEFSLNFLNRPFLITGSQQRLRRTRRETDAARDRTRRRHRLRCRHRSPRPPPGGSSARAFLPAPVTAGGAARHGETREGRVTR